MLFMYNQRFLNLGLDFGGDFVFLRIFLWKYYAPYIETTLVLEKPWRAGIEFISLVNPVTS